ncbi:metal ABC transporter solute-binding protein, Zn/Mn family [Chlamydiifrater phoenicopteri]|uniref:metal ABC transporter solute-binding protein, Zn/Mn family n=1 Tax=Chlamydiifrater phoenicopteri TaxID=2681469 RepID=UPI001BCF81C9|nr:zinc ABC transporter substrate-binding protein [Chlamydiifrater phoenicopteri]
MKRFLSVRALLLLFGAALPALTGCSSQKMISKTSQKTPYILATNRMIYDCVKEVAGESVQCQLLIKGELDPHSYELVKGDSDKIAGADVVFCCGLGLEHTLSLRKLLENNPKVVKLGDCLAEKNKFKILYEEGVQDPHIWLDMGIWKHVPQEIAFALAKAYPELSEKFFANANKLAEELNKIDGWAKQSLSSVPIDKRFLVTGHSAFRYFSYSYLAEKEERESGFWKERFISPEGISPEAQIGIRDIIRVSDYICEHCVEVVFPEESLNQDSLRKIVSCLKKKHCVRLSKQAIYSDNVPLNKSYFDMFKHNVCIITEELGGCVADF